MHLNKFEKCFLLHACKEELAYRKKQLKQTKQDKEQFIQNGINVSVVIVELKIEEMKNLIEKIRHE
tara:strand:+ start:360 stop:557 length:198 start_codon:yes stop_codon:yes gene_type:complete